MSEIHVYSRSLAGAALLLLLAVPALRAQSAARPVDLRCEYRANPEGIDAAKPRLSWALAAGASAHGVRQTAYRVVVAATEAALNAASGDLWDTGKVASSQSTQLVYAGKPLESGKRVFWKVQVWDQAGQPSVWSEPQHWSMGLLAAAWKAKWIGLEEAAPYRSRTSPFWSLQRARWLWTEPGASQGAPQGVRYFRARFTLPAGRQPRRAFVVMGADNEYELFLNGVRQGKGTSVHIPDTLDILTSLQPGDNTLAVKATSALPGFEGFRQPSAKNKPAGLIGAVRIEFASGEPLVFSSAAASWKASPEAPAGWEKAVFDDSRWPAAIELGAYGMKPWGEAGFAEEHVLPARMLRKEFDVKPGLARATVYLSGQGLSELYLNGAKAGDSVLSPALTDYDRRVLYVTYDVTALLRPGARNAAGVILGNGRFWGPRGGVPISSRSYGTPRLLLQMELEYNDGARETIVSDDSWKVTAKGPIRANNEYDGEEYDARLEMPGWDKPGFSDSAWEPAALVPAPKGILAAQMSEPMRVIESRKPVTITRLGPGRYIYDMGQNMVGWVRLKVSGPAGTRVMLRHAETLLPDGRLYMDNLRSARVTDFYTLKGAGTEVYEPRFTYHGFRFVELTGYPGEPQLDTLEGRVVHDAMPRAGDWTSSNDMLNRLHHNIYWGIRGNYRSIPTDCPQRDERQGWLGDRSVVSRSESYMFDIAAFYSKWIADIADSQRPTGSIPDVAPAFWTIYSDNMTWPATFLLAPAMLYEQYGDTRVIERDYAAMKKWMDYMWTRYGKDGLIAKDTYGDWCVPPESPELIHSRDPARKTDGTLISTAYYVEMLKLMSRYAALTGRKQDVAAFEARATQVRAAFDKKFYDAAKKQYDNGTQTSSIIPLAFAITPPEDRSAVFAHLTRKIETESDYHVGVGLVGAQWLMRTLSDNGRADLAFRIATQPTYPGWGYMIEQGATTVWELWNGNTADPAMNSGNHVMQIGDLNVWLYEYLAGIRADPRIPGFKHVIVKPYPVAGLDFVKASHKSLYGTIASDWKISGRTLTLTVTVPPNTTGTVYVPAAAQPDTPAGAKFLRMEEGRAVFDIDSGTYTFTARQ